ncbi:MAG: insulinase family protein [Candidatus Vogelbacteria bacterium]|nr:insulinase family protein [Candidatus Vogelbacteria bacterium]
MTPQIKLTKNGSRIVIQNIPDSKILNVNVFIKSGWRHEKEEEKEYTHLLEHLLMAGSKKYPQEKDMADVLESIGGKFNAQTSMEYLTLNGETLIENWERLLDLLFDKILNPNITQEAINKEQRVLEAEYNSQINNHIKWLERNLIQQIFSNSALITPPYPNPYPLKEIEIDQIKLFYNQVVRPELITVICVGNIKNDEIERFIMNKLEKIVRPLTKTSITSVPQAVPVNNLKLHNVKSESNDLPTDLRFSFVTIPSNHRLSFALDIISSYLGDGYQAKLFEELRLKNNLSYSYISRNIKLTDTGIYYFGLTTKYPREASELVKNYFNSWLSNIDESRLEKLKIKIINQAMYNFYSSQKNISFSYGFDLLINGQLNTLDDYAKKIRNVTLNDIKSVLHLLSINKAYILST